MPQTFCYLCIKKPLTLPHMPLRILKHRTKNTYELPKARITKRTNHKKNDPKNEPKSTNHEKNDQKHEPRKARPKRTNHEKHDRKERTTKRTTEKHEPRKERTKARITKSTTEKHEPQSTSPKHEPSPVVCKPASQSYKVQQAPLIASLRPRTQSSPYRSHVS